MPANADIRKFSLAMVVIIAMIAVLLPLCMGLSCGMSGNAMTGTSGFTFGPQCVKTMTSGVQAAVAPGSPQTLILTLVAVLGMMLVFAFPPLTMRPLRAVAKDPPPPPEDPRGVRLII